MTTDVEEQLTAAASSGDVDQLANLAKTVESLSSKTVQTLFREAASQSQLPVIEYLLVQFPSVPLNEDTIRTAIYTGSIPLFSALIERDPSIVRMQFDMRGTPLIVACMAKKPLDFLRFLLEAGADPNQDPDTTTFPLALVGAFYTDTGAVDLLLEHGAKLEGSEALSSATQLGNEVMIRYFLQRGAKPDTDVSEGRAPRDPPVHLAVKKARVGVLKILLDYGADVSVVDSKGKTLREVAVELEERGQDMSEIMELLKNYEQ